MIVKQISDISPTYLKIGDTVNYYSYGILTTGKIIRLSSDGILFLEGNRFVFVESIIKG